MMIHLYYNRKDFSDLHSVKLNETGEGIVYIKYTGIVNTPREKHPFDDELFDYLSAASSKFETIRNMNDDETRDRLLLKGYDLNLDHWAEIKCVYLPFVHYLYIPGGWII